MRTGRKSVVLTQHEKNLLKSYILVDNTGYQNLADKIGISYFQLYEPVNGRRNCSPQSYAKIRAYIDRREGK